MKCCCGAHVDVVTKTFAEHTLRSCVAAIILSSMLMSGAAAAGSGQDTATPPKIQELLILLADPKVQEWLKD